MVIILTLAVVVIAFIVVAVQQGNQIKETQQLAESSKTMSLEELLAANDAAEREWNEWNEKWAKKVAWKRDAQSEYNKRKHAGEKITQIRQTIKSRFPEVITDPKKLKEKAHSVATASEISKMRTLEDKVQSSWKALGSSGIRGGQLLENTHSSVLRGVAASTIAGPLAGGIVYSATEAQNKAITSSNIEKKAQNAVWDESTSRIKGEEDKLYELYIKTILKYDKNAKIHIYSMQYY